MDNLTISIMKSRLMIKDDLFKKRENIYIYIYIYRLYNLIEDQRPPKTVKKWIPNGRRTSGRSLNPWTKGDSHVCNRNRTILWLGRQK